jgi:hypothetical protein
MTEEQARALAATFLEEQGLPHAGFVEARFLCADRFNRLYGFQKYPEDFWVVEFRKRFDEGVVAESPSTIAIMVLAATGRACKLSSP